MGSQRALRQVVPAGKSAQVAQENEQGALSLVAGLEKRDPPAFEIAQHHFGSRVADFQYSGPHPAPC